MKTTDKIYLVIHKLAQIINAKIGMEKVIYSAMMLIIIGLALLIFFGIEKFLLVANSIGIIAYLITELLYTYNVENIKGVND